MTRDDIIRMAREAYGPITSQQWWDMDAAALKRFAALVAAAEREEIAQMVEDAPPLVEFAQNDKGGCMVCGFTPKLAAAAIRARGATEMSKLKTLTIPDHHKVQAKAVLNEAIDEAPDSVIVMCFWKDRGQFKIKTSMVPDRLMLIGAIEEAKNKIITDGYTS